MSYDVSHSRPTRAAERSANFNHAGTLVRTSDPHVVHTSQQSRPHVHDTTRAPTPT
jgi:hypothetical protein